MRRAERAPAWAESFRQKTLWLRGSKRLLAPAHAEPHRAEIEIEIPMLRARSRKMLVVCLRFLIIKLHCVQRSMTFLGNQDKFYQLTDENRSFILRQTASSQQSMPKTTDVHCKLFIMFWGWVNELWRSLEILLFLIVIGLRLIHVYVQGVPLRELWFFFLADEPRDEASRWRFEASRKRTACKS